MNYPRNNPIYLKQVYRFQSNQIKFENPKSLQPLKIFIVVLLKTLNPKSQIKARLSHLANSYFNNCKPSPRIPRQHRILRNLSKNKDIIIWKPDKWNGVVILDRKLYDSATQQVISDTSKFEKLNYYPTLKREASLRFYGSWNKKIFLTKMNVINCILLVLPKYTNFPLVIHFLKFVQLFHL